MISKIWYQNMTSKYDITFWYQNDIKNTKSKYDVETDFDSNYDIKFWYQSLISKYDINSMLSLISNYDIKFGYRILRSKYDNTYWY